MLLLIGLALFYSQAGVSLLFVSSYVYVAMETTCDIINYIQQNVSVLPDTDVTMETTCDIKYIQKQKTS